MSQVLKGIQDVDEIKILTYLILNRLSQINAQIVTNRKFYFMYYESLYY